MPLNSLKICAAALGLLTLASCQPGGGKHEALAGAEKNDTALKYARRFALERGGGFTAVHVFGNKLRPKDTTATFVIGSDPAVLADFPKRAVFIKGPCKKIAALSSIYANMLCDLGDLDKLAAVDNMDYVINPLIVARFKAGGLQELSKGPALNLEQTVALAPDVVFTFGMGNPGSDVNPKLVQSGIPVAVSIDHLEENPLARAEWIKFYAAFTGKAVRADSIFNATEKNYLALCALAKSSRFKPKVLTEIKYGDAWYVPGGNSYMARLLKDAGADYIWQDNTSAGSTPLSFEQVYARARDADYWLNLSMVTTKAELLSYEPRYAEFKAFKTGQLYNNNKVTNDGGYSTYWETGMIYPDRILSDLLLIFHPELNTGTKNELYYYRQLN